MTSRVSAKSTDTDGMIRMAQAVAANDRAARFLVPGYFGLDLRNSAPQSGQYLRIEANGEVWKHSRFERGGPNGPEAPKRIA